MTLESYRNFVAIVDCGSIMAAANKLLIAQPSLSHQLKNIEKTYGVQLVIRGPRSIELTEAGRIFYKKAREICMLEESMRTSLTVAQTTYREQLRISIPAGSSRQYIQKLFSSFAEKNPDINYDMYEIPSDFVIPNVVNGITEIGLIRSSVPRYNNLLAFPYERENIVAVVPEGHPLSEGDTPLRVEDFINQPLAVPFDILNIIYAVFAQCTVMPNVSVITSTNGTAMEWAQTFGSGALVSYSEEYTRIPEGMVVRTIDHESMYVMSVFLVHKDRKLSETARLFLEEAGVFPEFAQGQRLKEKPVLAKRLSKKVKNKV